MSEKEVDEVSGVSTTGHEWDGIKELDNPMPRWWLWTFYATVIWGIAYMIAYPAWPLISTSTEGLLGWSSRGDVRAELAAAQAAKSQYVEAVASKTVDEILADDNLRTFATAAGAAAYKVNCVQCHGSGASGSKGYPNLNDDDWLWGGKITDIEYTIAHGIRFAGDEDTRFSEMPAFRGTLNPEEVKAVANFTASLSGMNHDTALIEPGRVLFESNCASCHGEDGKGGREFGAPDLTDAISLYVHTEADMEQQILRPKHGVMPAWNARLGETTVKELATYIYTLGGGEK